MWANAESSLMTPRSHMERLLAPRRRLVGEVGHRAVRFGTAEVVGHRRGWAMALARV